MADDTLAFDSLSDEDLLKEAPANFFLTASQAWVTPEGQAESLELLAGYVREDQGRPIFVTGPAGFGKTTLVRQFMARNLPPRTEVEWISLREQPEPLRPIETALLRLRTIHRGARREERKAMLKTL
jgi:hypothetical protein